MLNFDEFLDIYKNYVKIKTIIIPHKHDANGKKNDGFAVDEKRRNL